MNIPQLVKPGYAVDLPDAEHNQAIRVLEMLMETAVSEATLALLLFQRAQQQEFGTSGLPRNLEHQQPFLHAKSFLYALDSIAKATEKMSEQPGSPDLRSILQTWQDNFSEVNALRNSQHHQEDRALGKARTKTINTQAINTGGIMADGGVMVLSHLSNSTFGCTKADGNFGEIDVTESNLHLAAKHVQSVIDALPWR